MQRLYSLSCFKIAQQKSYICYMFQKVDPINQKNDYPDRKQKPPIDFSPLQQSTVIKMLSVDNSPAIMTI